MITSIELDGYTGEPVLVSEEQIHNVYDGRFATRLLSGINCNLFIAMHKESNQNKIYNALKAL